MKGFYFILCLLYTCGSFSQDLQLMFSNEQYEDIINTKVSKKNLTFNDQYIIGCSFLFQNNQKKAISYFNDVIASLDDSLNEGPFTLDTGYLYFCKGLALSQIGKKSEALANLSKSLEFDAFNQIYLGEQAYTYFCNFNYDSALSIASKATNLKYRTDQPYYLVPHIYFKKRQYHEAIEHYQKALKYLSVESDYYYAAHKELAWIQLYIIENFAEAIKLYTKAIDLRPHSFYLYSHLIKAYYGNNQFALGDSIFNQLNRAFVNGWLYDDMDFFQRAEIDIIESDNYKAIVSKVFAVENKTKKYRYYIEVYNKENTLSRLLKISEENNIFHLIKVSDTPYKYPYKISINNYPSIKNSISKSISEDPI